MNMKIKERFTMKKKVKEHPNARKYPGRPSYEFGTAKRELIFELSGQELSKLDKGELILEEEATAELFDSIQVGDVIGLGLFHGLNENNMNPHNESAAYKFLILDKPEGEDVLHARNVSFEHPKRPEYKGTEVTLAFEDVSAGLNFGFGEILERDGKPFGVDEEVDQEIILMVPEDFDDEKEEETETDPDVKESGEGEST